VDFDGFGWTDHVALRVLAVVGGLLVAVLLAAAAR